ncbi:MAG: aspartate-semialdehyde dehydrogenase [Fimbriimonadaceae bacterium]|nr:aspartate-semialdehyde dehydrogenase [Fimbriimonadaceae bacterium]
MAQLGKVAIVGATGAVGRELCEIIAQRNPTARLSLLASQASHGQEIEVHGRSHTVREVTAESLAKHDVVFFCAGAPRSRQWAPICVEDGALVVDNSSAFRMDPEVPLVVPEVNPWALKPDTRLVANPNCVAAILTVALAPLAKLGHVRRLVLSTYQSASGGGAALMNDLLKETSAYLAETHYEAQIAPHTYAFNLFSHNTPIGEDGANEEEQKVAEETRKIMARPDLGVNVTCIRVPVLRAHSISATVEFEGTAPSVETAREALLSAEGVKVVDFRSANRFPMPSEASGADEVLVGRLRHDPSSPNALCLFACGDQLRKGAALNAVQIAERCLEMRSASPT